MSFKSGCFKGQWILLCLEIGVCTLFFFFSLSQYLQNFIIYIEQCYGHDIGMIRIIWNLSRWSWRWWGCWNLSMKMGSRKGKGEFWFSFLLLGWLDHVNFNCFRNHLWSGGGEAYFCCRIILHKYLIIHRLIAVVFTWLWCMKMRIVSSFW